jgi:hypothetical protein
MNKINTDIKNAKWHTLWKKRMSSGKPREGDYNFVVWQNSGETVVEPWDRSVPPSIFLDGNWIVLANDYREEK